MPIQSVKQGQFNFTPDFFTPRLSVVKIGWWITFSQNCNYIHTPENAQHQKSWLKIGGLSFDLNPFEKHENSALGGFRHNPDDQSIEVLDYWHVDGDSDHGIGREALDAVVFDETFPWWLEIDYRAKTVSQVFFIRGRRIIKTQQFTRLPRISWQVGAWAGGQIPATQDMDFDFTRIRRWANGLPVPD